MSNAIITTAGRDYFAQRAGESLPVNINRFLLCNISDLDIENDPNPDESIPDSATHVREIDVTQSGYVSAHQVVYSLFLGTQEGDYTFNWVGLLSDDDVLVAVRYIDPYTKRATANGETGNQITRNFLIAYTDAQELMNVTVDAATWQFDFNVATEERAGLVERATQDEVNNGTDTVRYVSPETLSNSIVNSLTSTNTARALSANQGRELNEKLAAATESLGRTATTTYAGLAEQATQAETNSGTDTTRYVSPSTLANSVINSLTSTTTNRALSANQGRELNEKLAAATESLGRTATTTYTGLVEQATQTEANSGTDTTRYISPSTLANSVINSLISTTTNRALSANQGRELNEKLVEAINLLGRTATTTYTGLVEQATQAETNNGTDTTRYISPSTLANSVINSLTSTTTNRALSANQGRELKNSITALQSAQKHTSLSEDLSVRSPAIIPFLTATMDTDTTYAVKGFVRILSANATGLVFVLDVLEADVDIVFNSLSITTLEDSNDSQAPIFRRKVSSSIVEIEAAPADIVTNTFAIAIEGTIRTTFNPLNNSATLQASAGGTEDSGTLTVGAGSYLTMTKVS